MKKLFYNIWKDPVFSKVISAGIIAAIGIIYIAISAHFAQTSFTTRVRAILNLDIAVWVILTCLIFALIIVALVNRIKGYKYSSEELEVDRKLFEKIRTDYLNSDVIASAQYNSFSSNPFKSEILDDLLKILDEEINPNFVFFNPHLEKRKNSLIKAVWDFRDIADQYTFGTNHIEFLSIPREWMSNNPERFAEAKQNIFNQENVMSELYIEFIRYGRKVLAV